MRIKTPPGDLVGTFIAIYARFSSDRQREASIDDQVRRCRDYIEREGFGARQVTVFADHAMSGASLDRPRFEALMRAVDDARVQMIVTEDVSRISRDFADAALVFRRLQFARVPLVGVADGIDTNDKHAKLLYALKSLVAEMYLDDLRDKTLRGLEGRALAGFATGLSPYGYRTHPEVDSRGNEIGRRVRVSKKEAVIIRRIFDEYAAGASLGGIARGLNRDSVPSPRAGTKHKRFGWGMGTIRAILYNEKYAGIWRFKERQWVRVPGSSKRLPQQRPASEVMTFERPELRIVDAETWLAVQEQLRAVHRHYTKASEGEVRPTPGRRKTPFVLSGILVCDACGAPLFVTGSTTIYYRCPDSRKGTCRNRMSVRERVILEAVSAFLLELVAGSEVATIRASLVRVSKGRVVAVDTELRKRRASLREAERRIGHLVQRLATTASDYVARALRELEEVAAAERAAIERLRRTARGPAVLPSAGDLRAWVSTLGAHASDINMSRARLASLLKDGHIRVSRDGEMAKLAAVFLPAALLTDWRRRLSEVDDTCSVAWSATVQPATPAPAFRSSAWWRKRFETRERSSVRLVRREPASASE